MSNHSEYLNKVLLSRVYDVAVETPLDEAVSLSRRLGNRVLLKRDDLQPVFSFKLRGAYNKMARLSPEELRRGVIAASAGNHAQGVALAAAKNGISDGENPEEAISREEFALILYRYAQYLGKQAIERADLSRYTDAGAVSETALPAVQWAAAEAILRGDNFYLHPQSGATRAEAAAMLHRFFTR